MSEYTTPYAVANNNKKVKIPMKRMKFFTYGKLLSIAKSKSGKSSFKDDDEMLSYLEASDINSISSYYYSLVSFIISYLKKQGEVTGDILLDEHWSLQGSCTDGSAIYVILYYEYDEGGEERKSYLVKIFIANIDGIEIYYLKNDFVANVSEIKHGSDMMYLPHLSIKSGNILKSNDTILILNSHKMMAINPHTLEIVNGLVFLYNTMDCDNEQPRHVYEPTIDTGKFICVNKFSGFAYNEYKDVIFVNYCCSKEQLEKAKFTKDFVNTHDDLIDSKILGFYRISDNSIEMSPSEKKYIKVNYTTYNSNGNYYKKVAMNEYDNLLAIFTPSTVVGNTEIYFMAQGMDSYKGLPILLRSGKYTAKDVFTNAYNRIYFLSPYVQEGDEKAQYYRLKRYITLYTGTLADNKDNFLEAENICHIPISNNTNKCRFYIGYNRHGKRNAQTHAHMLSFDYDMSTLQP